MTYDDIARWVDANFDVSGYASFETLMHDVKERFTQDGMTFPEQAEENILALYKGDIEEVDAETYGDLGPEDNSEIYGGFGPEESGFESIYPQEPIYPIEPEINQVDMYYISSDLPISSPAEKESAYDMLSPYAPETIQGVAEDRGFTKYLTDFGKSLFRVFRGRR